MRHTDTGQAAIDEDASGYLISVSDIMAGLLFVFLITLASFVINFLIATEQQEMARDEAIQKQAAAEDERDKARREAARLSTVRDDLTNARRLRDRMLEDIRRRLQAAGIRVQVDQDYGVLRLTEDAISFESARAELRAPEQRKLERIGQVLIEVLPCYAAAGGTGCDSATQGKLEAVFIEGHTDNVPLHGQLDNWDLSAQRAINTFRFLADSTPGLGELRNALGQPLFSVSGYGAGRPVVPHTAPTPEPRNRRIDLRFIMAPPKEAQEAPPVRDIRARGVH
jgi:flagellar motor protein MotB